MEQILFAPTAVTAAVDWTETATVVIAGIVIVLAMLIVLIFVFYIFGAIVSTLVNKNSKNSKKNNAKKTEVKQNSEATSKIAAEEESTKPADIQLEQTEETNSDELIAVISAAIAASEEKSNFTIKSIKKKNTTQRNAWAFAAVSHNTKPF